MLQKYEVRFGKHAGIAFWPSAYPKLMIDCHISAPGYICRPRLQKLGLEESVVCPSDWTGCEIEMEMLNQLAS